MKAWSRSFLVKLKPSYIAHIFIQQQKNFIVVAYLDLHLVKVVESSSKLLPFEPNFHDLQHGQLDPQVSHLAP
jgi:hypothetical protein